MIHIKDIRKLKIILLCLCFILAALSFALGAFVTKSHNRLSSHISETLPQGVHFPMNINTADVEALCLLDGIGEKTAEKIIDYREENGNFKTKEDLKNVKGIGDKKLQEISPYICVE